MKSIGETIRDLAAESDIAIESDIYAEIYRELTQLGLNLAGFVFQACRNSQCARQFEGTHVTCPVLTLYLRFESDFVRTGIDPQRGNWDDQWPLTRTIRDLLNSILWRHGFGEAFVSTHTFIFARTLEAAVFSQIARESDDEIKKMVCAELSGANVEAVYWCGRTIYLLMRDKADYRRGKRNADKLAKAISKLLATADKDSCCQDYSVSIEFGYDGAIPIQFVRG